MRNTITDPAALVAAVRQAAKDHPDFVYHNDGGGCDYEPDELNPYGCIVGHASRQSGQPLTNGAVSVGGIEGVCGTPYEDWLDTAQSRQDNGDSWSKAVERADVLCSQPATS